MIKCTRITGARIPKQTDYIALDTETTGLHPPIDRMIEIGILEVKGNQVVNTFGSFINPEFPVPADATAINGITDADLVDAPSYAEIAPTVAGMVLGKVIIAHNASFDLKFVCAMLEEAGFEGEIKYIDTLGYARKCLPDLPNHKLQTLAAHFSIDTGNAHRAVDDARTCHLVFQQCKQLPQPKAETRSHTEATPVQQEKAQATANANWPKGRIKTVPLLIGILFIISGLFHTSSFASGFLGVVVGLGLALWGLAPRFSPSVAARSGVLNFVGSDREIHVSGAYPDRQVKYHYKDFRIFTPAEDVKKIGRFKIKRGDQLTLRKEPKNSYDRRAIAVCWNGKRLGYLYDNEQRGMLRKSIDTGEPYLLIFDHFSTRSGDQAAYIHVVFF